MAKDERGMPETQTFLQYDNRRGQYIWVPMEDYDALRSWSKQRIAELKARVKAVEGYVLVPEEPTDEMLMAAQTCGGEGEDDALKAWATVYKAMLDAARKDSHD